MIAWLVALASAAMPLALDALPGPVAEAVSHRWPDRKPISASRDGSEVTVELTNGLSAVLKFDGTLVETDETVDPNQIPEPQRSTVAGKGEIKSVVKRTGADGKVQYDVTVASEGKTTQFHLDGVPHS